MYLQVYMVIELLSLDTNLALCSLHPCVVLQSATGQSVCQSWKNGQVTDACHQSVSVYVILGCVSVCLSPYIQVADQNQFDTFASLSLDEVRFHLQFVPFL